MILWFDLQLPGQESADLDDNSEESDDDGRDTDFGRSERPTSERQGGQMILEAQPEINMKVPSNHFDFGAILPMLSNLEEVHVCYKVFMCPFNSTTYSKYRSKCFSDLSSI